MNHSPGSETNLLQTVGSVEAAGIEPAQDSPGLEALARESSACTRCSLAATRTQVVFGAGSPGAQLLFIGEAPGAAEDESGLPFVGRSGKLLDELLAGISLSRADVYIANVLLCRPPGNRNPAADEIEACSTYLFRRVALLEPLVVATLGNFATRLLTGRPAGIHKIHGKELELRIGAVPVYVYPLYHPAAALYTPSLRKLLVADFAKLPELLTRDRPLRGEEPPAADEQLALEPGLHS